MLRKRCTTYGFEPSKSMDFLQIQMPCCLCGCLCCTDLSGAVCPCFSCRPVPNICRDCAFCGSSSFSIRTFLPHRAPCCPAGLLSVFTYSRLSGHSEDMVLHSSNILCIFAPECAGGSPVLRCSLSGAAAVSFRSFGRRGAGPVGGHLCALLLGRYNHTGARRAAGAFPAPGDTVPPIPFAAGVCAPDCQTAPMLP